MPKPLSIAIVGAGIGGLAVAATLRRFGMEVRIYEQAERFARIGAGIQMMPNSMQVLRHIGIEERLRRISFAPHSHLNRVWDTGEVTRELPMPESLYGAPYLCMHRADLHEALLSALPPDIVRLGCKLVGLDATAGSVALTFADGSRAIADAVIGADGVHSVVRDIIVGPDAPIHKGRIAYRAVFPAALMNGHDIGPSRTKWWGVDRHIVIYYTNPARSEVYFVTSVPEPAEWLTRESWSAKGDVRELRAAYAGFHRDVRAVLDACPDCHKWAILEREPLPRWTQGRAVLLGDAAHPMTPYMAQGGATAIEDAAVLARCLAEVEGEDIEGAFRRYEAHRKPRTSVVQAISSANTWMREGTSDTAWLYGYDAWHAALDEPASHPADR
ncbi:MAG TPA: FAD-dependent monooxygenase [Hyphomicrobiaceae bacterium]|jgi:salicylate hydroxylase/6-hydroxynicotinate 3-monooxygenase